MGHLAGQGDCPSRWSEFRRPRGGGWGETQAGQGGRPGEEMRGEPGERSGWRAQWGLGRDSGASRLQPPRPHVGGLWEPSRGAPSGRTGLWEEARQSKAGRRGGRQRDPPRLVHLSPLLGPAPGTRLAGTRSRSRLSEQGAQSPGLRPGAHLPFARVPPSSPAASAECKGPERVSPPPGWRYHPDRWQTPLQGGEKVYRQPIQGKRPRTAKPWGPQRGSPDPRPDRPRRVQCGTPARGPGCTRGP